MTGRNITLLELSTASAINRTCAGARGLIANFIAYTRAITIIDIIARRRVFTNTRARILVTSLVAGTSTTAICRTNAAAARNIASCRAAARPTTIGRTFTRADGWITVANEALTATSYTAICRALTLSCRCIENQRRVTGHTCGSSIVKTIRYRDRVTNRWSIRVPAEKDCITDRVVIESLFFGTGHDCCCCRAYGSNPNFNGRRDFR